MADTDDSSSGLMGNTGNTSATPTTSGNSGGILSTLGGLMKMADPQFLMSVGAGLMAGARYGSNAGEGLLQGLQLYHQTKTNDLQNRLQRQQIQEGQLGLQQRQMMLGAAQQAFNGGQGQTQPPVPAGALPGAQGAQASGSSPFLPGVSQMPAAGGQPAPQPQAAPQGLPASLQAPSMSQIYGTTFPGGASPNYTRGMALLSQDPAAALLKARDDQLKLAQENYAPGIAKLDTLIKSDTPSKYMKADPDLRQAWPQLATTLGMDPDKDYNDQNVRTALTYARNQMAASLSEPTEAPTNALRTVQLPDGRTAQIDPVTGKQTVQEASPLEKVIGPNGQPILVPNAKAAGMTPFNQSIFGASNMDDQTKELAYQFAKVNGGKLPPWMSSRGDAAKGAMANYIAQRASQEGLTGASMVAQGQATQAAGNVLKDFTSGATNKKLVAINTGVEHLDALNPLIDAMDSGNLTAINKARQFFEKQTGKPAPTNYSTLANMAVGEVSQAVMAGGGTGPERDDLAAPFKSSNAPDVLRGAVQQAITALAGKTDGLRTSWDAGTNGTQGAFERFLGPATKKALGIPESAATPSSPSASTRNAAASTAPVRVSSPQEALALKPGTVFVTPDGRTKVR